MVSPWSTELVPILLFPLGMMELLLIFAIVVIIFGASKLPQLGKGLGEGISNFKAGLRGKDDEPREKKDN